MSLEELIRTASTRAGTVRVRNALNPLLWTVAWATPVCFLAAYALRDETILRYGLAILGALPILMTFIAYFNFMLRDPDRLQSEEYRIKQEAIQVLQRKGRGSDIVDIAREVPRIEKVHPRSSHGERS